MGGGGGGGGGGWRLTFLMSMDKKFQYKQSVCENIQSNVV